MSREIKFRAWDGDRMTNCGIQFNNTTGMLENKGNIALMQFTGLRDANGIEIYEGDVLKLEHGKHYWIYVVSVIDGFGSLLFACEIENNLSVDSESDRFTFQKQPVKLGSRRDFVSDRMQVIGNIYEHPHLLDEAK